MHDFSHNLVKLKGQIMKKEMEKIVLTQLAETPQARTMAKEGGNL